MISDKNPAYGGHQISQSMRIEALISRWCHQYHQYQKKTLFRIFFWGGDVRMNIWTNYLLLFNHARALKFCKQHWMTKMFTPLFLMLWVNFDRVMEILMLNKFENNKKKQGQGNQCQTPGVKFEE